MNALKLFLFIVSGEISFGDEMSAMEESQKVREQKGKRPSYNKENYKYKYICYYILSLSITIRD